MKVLDIGKDFSKDPIGRFRSDSSSSGEAFREDVLKPRLESLGPGEKLQIVLDSGVEGYGSSFLVEGFAGIVKHGYMTANELLGRLEFKYDDSDFEFYKNKVIQYIGEAVYASETYNSKKVR
jgi:hypothetical protein